MSQTKAQLISDLVQALAFTATASAPTNGMFLSAANELAISTNSTQRLTVDSSGNVGIGTTSPSVLLHVSSSGDTIARVTSADGNSAFLDLGDASDPDGGRIVYDSGSNLTFSTGSAERLRINSSGNVGIGTTSPGTKLDVNDGSANCTIRGRTGSGFSSFLHLLPNGSGSGISLAANSDSSAQLFNQLNSHLTFGTNNTERLRIDSSGKVGIGVTPTSPLHVKHATFNTVALFESGDSQAEVTFKDDAGQAHVGCEGDALFFKTSSSGTERLRIDSSGNLLLKTGEIDIQGGNKTVKTSAGFLQVGTSGSHHLAFITNGSERARIDSSGNVGIGTTSPDDVLDVRSGAAGFSQFVHASGQGGVRIAGTGSGSAANLVFSNNHTNGVTDEYTIQMSGDNDRLTFRSGGTGDTERVVFMADGKVGIGTTSPGCQTGGIHAVHDATEGTPSFTGGEVAIFQRNFNNAQGCHVGIIGGTTGTSSINFGDKDDADTGIIQYGHSDNSMRFFTNTSERGRIDSSGRLMLGTTSVRSFNTHTGRFQVQGTDFSSQTVSIVANSNDGNGGFLFFGKQRSGAAGGNTIVQNGDLIGQIRANACDGVDMETVAGTIEFEVDGTPGANDMPGRILFHTTADGASATSERMRISANGAVGINSTSNSNRLRIHEGSDTPNVVIVTGADESSEFLALGVDGGAPSVTAGGVGSTSASLIFRTADNGTESEAARIDKDGRFIAGMTATWDSSIGHQFRSINNNGWALNANSLNTGGPNHFLIATGRNTSGDNLIRVETNHGALGGAGTTLRFKVDGAGNVFATNTTVQSASDERLKENIRDSEDGLAIINQLRPVRFDWKQDQTFNQGTNQLGFIAQEVEAVFPEAVGVAPLPSDFTGDDPEYKTVGPGAFIPVLVKALQEASAKIEALETKVAALEAE